MTILVTEIPFPEMQPLSSSNTTLPSGTVQIDPTNPDELAIIGTIPQDGDLKAVHVGFIDTIAATLTCRIETVTPGTGNPTGTLIDANAVITKVVGIDTNFQMVEFLFPALVPVNAGDIVAIRISTNSGPIQARRHTELQRAFPYLRQLSVVTWSEIEGMVAAVFQYDLTGSTDADDQEYIAQAGGLPVSEVNDTNTFMNATERLYVTWIMPFAAFISGAWLRGRLDDGSGTGQMRVRFARIDEEAVTEITASNNTIKETILGNEDINEVLMAQDAAPNGYVMNVTFSKEIEVQLGDRVALIIEPAELDWTPIQINLFKDAFADLTDLSSVDSDKWSFPFTDLIELFVVDIGTGDEIRRTGCVPDCGIILREIAKLISIGGGTPPGVVAAASVVKARVLRAESIRQLLTDSE